MDVREMNFDGGNTSRRDGVPERDARVRVSRRIQDQDFKSPPRRMNPTDECAFEIGLTEIHRRASTGRLFANRCLEVRQGGFAINLRFTLTEEVQVWAVEKENLHRDDRVGAGDGF